MSFLDQLLDPAHRFEQKYAEHLVNRFRGMPFPGARLDLERAWIEPRGLNTALACEARLAIVGAAGMGKTTTLAHLALSHARALLAGNRRARVPIFFSVRELDPSAPLRIPDLPRGLNVSDALAVQCPRIFFAEVITRGRALVLIDDLDALPSDAVEAWLRDFASARIVVTAESAPANFAEFRLPGFRDGDIDAFARKLENADAFIAALRNVPRPLTANPLTLTLLARVWQTNEPLPTRRTELFDAYAHRMLNDDETAKMLEEVALAIQSGRAASNGFLSKAHGFMRAGRNRTAEFAHGLWQAYFAARAFSRSPELAPLLEFLQDPRWHDTFLFYAGMTDASALVNALLARGDLFSAGRVIAHARAVHADLRESVMQEIIRCAWNGDARAVAVLAEMSDATIADEFAAKLKDKDPIVRRRAAEILGQLQMDRGVGYLLPQLRDANANVRDKVVESLGRSRSDRVIEPLLVALRGVAHAGQVDTRLRVAAAKALGEVGSDKAVPALVVDLQIGEPEVRAAAAESLRRIASPLMHESLRGILESGDEQVRQYAAGILATVDSKANLAPETGGVT